MEEDEIEEEKEEETETNGNGNGNNKSILIKYINERVQKKNKNFLMVFIGGTGSGKSYAALKLAETLDNTFDISRCCFKAEDFMNVINEIIVRSEKGEDIRGKVILWDEFGVEHDSKRFMTISNRVINYFFQTSRHLNLIVIMTVPLLSFIDSSTRKLCHGIGEMCGIDSKNEVATVKIKMLQTNVLTGKEYPKYMRYRNKRRLLVSKRLKFDLPSPELRATYEKKKKEFTTQLNQEIMSKLLKVKKDDILTDPQANYLELYQKFNENVFKVAEYLGTTPQNVRMHIRRAKMRLLGEKQLPKLHSLPV
jgi:hypothetical protein